MDESLKARLIGGAVLVTLVVLLVPELLSGPKSSQPEPGPPAGERGTRTYTIDLGGATPVQPALEPAPAAPEAKPAPEQKPEKKPEPEAAKPVEQAPPAVAGSTAPESRPEPVPEPAATAKAPPKGGWSVQVGAFGSADSARKLVKELGADGYAAYLAPVTRAGKTLHRVRVGPEAARADADRLATRLKTRGLPATVVAND